MNDKLGSDKGQSLPPGWRWVRLSSICSQDRQIIEARSEQAKKLPYVGLEDIEANTGRIVNSTFGDNELSGISTTFLFNPKHVLYGKLRPYLNKVALPDFAGRCTTEIIPLLPDEGTHREFLAWLLRSTEFLNLAMRGTTGSRMPRADMKELGKIFVAHPPFAEQKRIAGILNEKMATIDKARAAAEAQLAAIKTLQFSSVKESLSSVPLIPIQLSECLLEVKKGIGTTWSQYAVLGATRDGLSLARERPGKHPERYKPVTKGTIFYNPMRILLGSIAYVADIANEGITSPDYVVFKTKTGILHYQWFYHWLKSPLGDELIRSLARGAVRERMLFNRLSKGVIKIPRWEVQLSVVDRIGSVFPLIERVEAQLNEFTILPQAILRQAFSGEL